MNKKNIIIYIIISVTLIILLSIFIVFKNKRIYISNIHELDNVKISMLKFEDGVTTVIKQVPMTGEWIMTYNCDDENVKIYWDEDNRKLFMKNIKPTTCTIKFEKSLSAVNIISMYVDDIYVGELNPVKNYILNRYECTNNETVNWKIKNRAITIEPLNTNTKCKLYFEEAPVLANQILKDNTPQSDASINFDSITGNGLYYTSNSTYGEDNQRIYYYRGRVDNNWVSFAGKLWRIVRTTSEGGVKLVYSGDGNTTSSGIANNSIFNSTTSNKYYIGYTRNTDLNGYIGAQTNSIIKTAVDTWYNNNLKLYESYLSPTAIYCSDRSSERISGTDIYYPAYDRVKTNYRPSYECLNINSSRYTVSTDTGNGYLSNPIALLSIDELNYAGVRWGTGSLNSYIMDNAAANWWTMTPSYFFSSNAFNTYVNSGGYMNNYNVSFNIGLRPSISLKSSITVSGGNGSKGNPYLIE